MPADVQIFLEQHVRVQGDDCFLSYRQMQWRDIPDELIAALAAHDVYETPRAETYCRLARERWQAFVAAAQQADEISIFECCFLQNPLTVLLGKHNVAVPDAVGHIRAVTATVQPLRPILVYLWQQDARAALERVVGERPQEWKDFVIDYFTQQGWGKAARASGFECVIAFYEHCAIRSDRMRIQDVLLLYDYNYWATKRILAASTNVSVQQFLAPTTHSYGSLRGTLVHTLDAEYGWRMVCQHNTLTPDMSEAEFPALDVLEQRWREEEMAMRDYLASLQDNHPATSISRCS